MSGTKLDHTDPTQIERMLLWNSCTPPGAEVYHPALKVVYLSLSALHVLRGLHERVAELEIGVGKLHHVDDLYGLGPPLDEVRPSRKG